MTQHATPAVELSGIVKTFGQATAIRDVTLTIAKGEFVTILGPSGCGKSTLLRMISGFAAPDAGDVRIEGQSMLGLPPYRRDTAMVFQDYALFPHRTVAQNIAFGLRMRKIEKREIVRRVDEMLELVNLAGFGHRRVSEISGGQAQRVALGRALIVRPAVLLLDEPLGALDMKLRRQMQAELKRLHRDLGLTFVAVTHDQEEALTLSDRIAVMNTGQVEQFDTPERLYRYPASRFVADFVGAANLIPVSLLPDGIFTHEERPLPGLPISLAQGFAPGAHVALVVRPEVMSVGQSMNGCSIIAEVEEVLFSGAVQQVIGRLADGSRIVAHQNALLASPSRGARVPFTWDATATWIVAG